MVVKSLIYLGVGVIGLVLPLVVLEISKVAFLLSGIMSKMDMTSVKRMCSEADLDFRGFKYRYIKLASRLSGRPGLGGFVEAGAGTSFSPPWAAIGGRF